MNARFEVSEGDEKLLSTFLHLLKSLWPKTRFDLRLRVVGSMVCLLLGKICGVGMPFIFRDTINALDSNSDEPLFYILLLVFAYGGARILQSLFNELRDRLFIRVSQHAQREIALITFKHLHELSLAFHLDRQTGGLSRIIDRGIKGISFVLSFMMFNIIPTLLELVLVTAFLAWIMDWRFAVIIFGTVVIYVVFTAIAAEWRLKFRREMNREDTLANTRAVDSLLNYETVKYFANEKHEYQRFDESLARYEESAVGSQHSLFMLNVGQSCIIGIGSVIMLFLGAYEVKQNHLTIGDFVMLSTYMMQIFIPLNFLGFVYREVKQGLIDMSKMTELWRVEPSVNEVQDAKNVKITSGRVEFIGVDFSYQKERSILKKVSFSIAGGSTLGIVGVTGSGKSTIARLLFRFYDPTAGKILIDGQDIRTLTFASLHKAIGVVPQDTVLFNDTIGYNIEYGCPGIGTEKVYEAAKRAKIADFIEKLPQKMDTLVGERGLKLSGGEKQRVSIARTILKDPPILIFDEATSALDSSTEREIQLELEQLATRKTTLIIAHRLSTVMKADAIIVLNEGEILERGTHQELMAKQGLYYSMWNKQELESEYLSRINTLSI